MLRTYGIFRLRGAFLTPPRPLPDTERGALVPPSSQEGG